MRPDIDDLDRRTVLHGAAGVLAAGALAGCSSNGSGDSGSNGSEGSGTETEAATDGNTTAESTATDAGTTTEPTDGGSATSNASAGTETTGVNETTATNDTSGTNETSATNNTSATNGTTATNGTSATTVGTGAVDEYLAEANGYDGSIADGTGSNTVEIAVGAGENGFAFEPAAVRVSPGTTVVWQWTGKGGRHNVISKSDGPLDSGPPKAGKDVTYEETLDSPGVYSYYCNPHRSLGMKGAVVVTSQ